MILGFSLLLIALLLLNSLQHVRLQDAHRKKKYNQEVKQRAASAGPSKAVDPSSSEDSPPAAEGIDGALKPIEKVESDNKKFASDDEDEDEVLSGSSCPLCSIGKGASKATYYKVALQKFWQGSYEDSFACLCQYMAVARKSNSIEDLAKALMFTLRNVKDLSIPKSISSTISLPTADVKSILKHWEVLGPINVGKMELDGDTTFHIHRGRFFDGLDPASYILSLSENQTVYSDLWTEGLISWKKFTSKANGHVDIHFNAAWNEVAQSLSSTAVYEFQGWARAVTYVKAAGSYIIECQGAHTLYICNDFLTHTLVADVYLSGKIRSSVDLKPGIVGIVIPLRAVAQAQFLLTITAAPAAVAVYPPQMVPHLLELEDNRGSGLLLSNLFMLPVHNAFSHSITLDFAVDKPLGEDSNFYIKEARKWSGNSSVITHCSISPGQTVALPLELITINPNDHKEDKKTLPYISCRENRAFTIIVTPSRGQAVQVPLEFQCRRWDQSFLISFLDHDDTVSQAAIILPLDFHSSKYAAKSRRASSEGKSRRSKSTQTSAAKDDSSDNGSEECPLAQAESCVNAGDPAGYPVILTLHGSGIPAINHADAHKLMPASSKDYIFGVEGFYLVAPSRFGAHNWEGVGDLTARSAINELNHLIDVSKGLLPPLDPDHGVIAGHSMGGHGAWVTAINAPDRFICVLPASGWIKKEEYGNSNLFFNLDVSTSFASPSIKLILERSLSEYHVDRLASNLQGRDVHIRVGSHDSTTHPWFSRRMFRVLEHLGVNATIEEVLGKMHWWWDTKVENDGGVLNDARMRRFYASCLLKATQQQKLVKKYAFYKSQSSRPGQSFRNWYKNSTSSLVSSGKLSGRTGEVKVNEKMLDKPFGYLTCDSNLTLSVINPALQEGYCGVQVLQQHEMLALSKVSVSCTDERDCHVRTSNVRRLLLSFNFGAALFEARQVTIDGQNIDLDGIVKDSAAAVHICLGGKRAMIGVCSQPLQPLSEKFLVNYGPVRRVYDQAFFIVYGTPPDQALRIAMRDFAVYLGNAHYAAHSSYVQVVSDLEFRSGNHARRGAMPNIVFVGDVDSNKLLKAVIEAGSTTETVTANKGSKSSASAIQGRIPEGLTFEHIEESEDVKEKFGFKLGNVSFVDDDHSVIFSMPLYRDPTTLIVGSSNNNVKTKSDAAHAGVQVHSSHSIVGVAMGVCIHANTALGYYHISRLAWPVIPPMVRAPFANYIPDFVVMDHQIWAFGPGALLAAGFWDANWRLDPAQAYFADDR